MTMSNPPGDNTHFLHDATERPISVYDNLSSTVNYSQKDDKKHNSIELPFSNISFKFNGDDADVTQNNVHQHSERSQKRGIHSNESQRFSNTNCTTVAANESHQDAKQYSDTNGKKSQEIVIDKPVISDAKSKFFGLVSNATDASESTKLLDSIFKDGIGVVQPQPQYQNLPSNSAIYRNKFRNSETPTSNPIGLPQDIVTDSNIEDSATKDYRSGPEPHSNRSTKCYPLDTDFSVNHHPSQAVYMSTTVPQNIKGNNIAGRHTPTRNSLRHSRMLVINKNYQGFKAPNPLHLRYPRLMKSVLILQIILGVILTFIGVWILLWAPNTRMQDNPYWSGLALTLAGIFGIVLIRFKRIKRQKLRENCFTFIKVDSYVLALLATVLCVIALACALIHLRNLMAESTKCTSTNILVANAACICTFGTPKENVTLTTLTDIKEDDSIYNESEFQYRDLSCSEVVGAWKYILIMSAILNGLGFFITIAYLILLYCRRDKQTYSTVRTDNF